MSVFLIHPRSICRTADLRGNRYDRCSARDMLLLLIQADLHRASGISGASFFRTLFWAALGIVDKGVSTVLLTRA